MTTDRPTATRATALPQRPYSGAADRSQAAPSDAFSALLGAASPRPADAPRAEARPRRDDTPRADQPKPKPTADKPAPKDDQPKADEPRTEPTATEEPTTDPKPRPGLTPDLFALQLASPLLTTPTPVVPTTAPQAGTAVPAEGDATPAIPAFPQLNNLLAGLAPATAEAAQGQATATPAPGAATPGGIPLPFLAGLTPASQTDLPKIELPATPPTELPADAAAPQLDTAALPNPGGNQTGSDTPQQQQNPQTAAAGAPQAAKQADQPAPATTTQPVAQAAPVTAPAPTPAATGLQRAVPLYRAPESAAQMIQLASQRGITHAKLNLKPVELGGIEVRLQTTPHGVTAQLVADSAEAAKLLTQAADDLRRDLADRDVNLLSLDVTTQQQYQEQQAGSKQADIFGDQLPGNVRNVRVGLHGDDGLTDAAAAADTSLVLPNGVLVDVLA